MSWWNRPLDDTNPIRKEDGMLLRRRELLGSIGTSAAGLAIMATSAQAGSTEAQTGLHDPKQEQMWRECDEGCGHWEAPCNASFHHCISLAAAGKTHHAKMAQIVADCAAFCNLSAVLIARHSPLLVESCRACA